MKLFDGVQRAHHHFHKIFHLCLVCLLNLLKGIKIFKFSGLRPHLPAGHLTYPVKHGQLQTFGQIKIACIGPSHGISVGRGLHTADNRIISGVFQTDAVLLQRLYDNIVIKKRQLSALFLHKDLNDPFHKTVRIPGGQTDARIGLRIKYRLLGFQTQIAQLVHCILALCIHTSQHKIDSGGEASVISRTGIGPCLDNVAVFDPEGFQKLPGLFLYENAPVQIPSIIRIKDLIHSAAGDGGTILAAVIDQDTEPVGLQRFIKRICRFKGNLPAVGGNQQKLFLPASVLLCLRHMFRQFCKTVLEDADAVAQDHHRLIEILLLRQFRIHEVQLFQIRFGFLSDPAKAHLQHLFDIGQIMPVSAPGTTQRIERPVGRVQDLHDLLINVVSGPVAGAPVLPVGVDLLQQIFLVFLADLKRIHLPHGHQVQLLLIKGPELRKDQSRPRPGAVISHNQLFLINKYSHLFQHILQSDGASHDKGHPFRTFITLCNDPRPFHTDGGHHRTHGMI